MRIAKLKLTIPTTLKGKDLSNFFMELERVLTKYDISGYITRWRVR